MVEGVSHITFIVKDLERATAFFTAIFNAEQVYDSQTKPFSLSSERFFIIGSQWIAIMEGEALSERTYNHVAFKIKEEEFDKYEAKVRALGVDVRPPRPRVEGEGHSLYFYDFDNHLFELHTGNLADRLARYAR